MINRGRRHSKGKYKRGMTHVKERTTDNDSLGDSERLKNKTKHENKMATIQELRTDR